MLYLPGPTHRKAQSQVTSQDQGRSEPGFLLAAQLQKQRRPQALPASAALRELPAAWRPGPAVPTPARQAPACPVHLHFAKMLSWSARQGVWRPRVRGHVEDSVSDRAREGLGGCKVPTFSLGTGLLKERCPKLLLCVLQAGNPCFCDVLVVITTEGPRTNCPSDNFHEGCMSTGSTLSSQRDSSCSVSCGFLWFT